MFQQFTILLQKLLSARLKKKRKIYSSFFNVDKNSINSGIRRIIYRSFDYFLILNHKNANLPELLFEHSSPLVTVPLQVLTERELVLFAVFVAEVVPST